MRTFKATLAVVPHRGQPPITFLDELVTIITALPDEVFAPNAILGSHDIYNVFEPVLGPWSSLAHRRAVMCEVLRVLAGLESSWKWNEGVDTTNQHSQTHLEGQETGAFQVSFDSVGLSPTLAACVLEHCGGVTAALFIPAMKSNHAFAVEYAARLLRFNTAWDGPISRGELNAAVNRNAVAEFQALLAVS